MPSPFFWGSLTQGIGQGLQQAEERKRKGEQLKLEQQKLKIQQQEADMKAQQFKDLMLGRQRAGQTADEMLQPQQTSTGWNLYQQDETSPQFGQEPPQGQDTNYAPLNPEPAPQSVATPPSLRTRLLAEAVRSGKIPSEAFKEHGSPQDLAQQAEALKALGFDTSPTGAHQLGASMGPSGTSLRVTPRPQTPAANRVFQDTLAATGSVEAATAAYNHTIGGASEARGYFNQQGQLNAQQGFPTGTPATGASPLSSASPLSQGSSQLPRTAPNPAQSRFNQQKQTQAAATGRGSELGKLEVHQSPGYLQNRQDVSKAEATGTQQPKANERLVGMSGTTALVDKITELAGKLPAGEGFGRFVEGSKLKLEALAQSNPDAAQLEQLRNSYSNILNRSLLAEKGVLTDQDRKFATDAIPSLFDTKEMRQRKTLMFKTLNNLLLNGEQSLAEGKFNPTEFRAKMNSMQNGSSASAPIPAAPSALPPPPAGWH